MHSGCTPRLCNFYAFLCAEWCAVLCQRCWNFTSCVHPNLASVGHSINVLQSGQLDYLAGYESPHTFVSRGHGVNRDLICNRLGFWSSASKLVSNLTSGRCRVRISAGSRRFHRTLQSYSGVTRHFRPRLTVNGVLRVTDFVKTWDVAEAPHCKVDERQ